MDTRLSPLIRAAATNGAMHCLLDLVQELGTAGARKEPGIYRKENRGPIQTSMNSERVPGSWPIGVSLSFFFGLTILRSESIGRRPFVF